MPWVHVKVVGSSEGLYHNGGESHGGEPENHMEIRLVCCVCELLQELTLGTVATARIIYLKILEMYILGLMAGFSHPRSPCRLCTLMLYIGCRVYAGFSFYVMSKPPIAVNKSMIAYAAAHKP